jgi:hypothetical protein
MLTPHIKTGKEAHILSKDFIAILLYGQHFKTFAITVILFDPISISPCFTLPQHVQFNLRRSASSSRGSISLSPVHLHHVACSANITSSLLYYWARVLRWMAITHHTAILFSLFWLLAFSYPPPPSSRRAPVSQLLY